MKARVSEWAAAEGIKRQAAYQRLKKIGVKPRKGLIDVEAVNEKWARSEDAIQGARNPSGVKKSVTEKHEPDIAHRGEDKTSLEYLQRRKAFYEGREKQLKVEVAEGKLVVAADVATEWGRMISAARSMALLMPDKLAPKIAPISDVRECRQIIAAEINAMLTGLSEYRPNE